LLPPLSIVDWAQQWLDFVPYCLKSRPESPNMAADEARQP
jgi:hypothetical protein